MPELGKLEVVIPRVVESERPGLGSWLRSSEILGKSLGPLGASAYSPGKWYQNDSSMDAVCD